MALPKGVRNRLSFGDHRSNLQWKANSELLRAQKMPCNQIKPALRISLNLSPPFCLGCALISSVQLQTYCKLIVVGLSQILNFLF